MQAPAAPNLSREQSLVLAAAGVDHPRARQPLDGELDWTAVIELTLRHRLAPSLLALLEVSEPSLVPADLLSALRAHCQVLEGQSQALIDESWALLEELEARGVTAIPFKGPLLGELLFGDFRWRSPGDIDILVRREQVRLVREVLERRDYVDAGRGRNALPLTDVQQDVYERFQCEYQYVREADDLVVEPHWGLSQRPLAIGVDYPGMLQRARPKVLCGRSVLMLAPEDLLVALSVHGSKHSWLRLAWARDVAGVLSAFPDLDLSKVMTEARTAGNSRLVLLSLTVAQACAGATLPDWIVRAAEQDRTVGDLVAEIRAKLFDPAAEEPSNTRISRFRLEMRERWRDRLRYVGRTLISPRRHHLELVALPRQLRWGYFIVKVGIDSAVTPAWKALKTIGRLRVTAQEGRDLP